MYQYLIFYNLTLYFLSEGKVYNYKVDHISTKKKINKK